MRHFLLLSDLLGRLLDGLRGRFSGAIAALSRGMGVTTLRTVLIVSPGLTQGEPTPSSCAVLRAVAMTVVATTADEYGVPAVGAEVASS